MLNLIESTYGKNKNIIYKNQNEIFTFKEKKLISFLDSVLNDPLHWGEITPILGRFNLKRDDIIQAFLDYNLDVHSHDNEIYQSQAIRVVLHIHNLIKGSWHIERQKAVSHFIQKAAPKKAIDLGFGVPSRYVREVCASFPFHLTLCDNTRSAFTFAEALLSIWDPDWPEKIDFLYADMEDVKSCVGDYDLYISLHSIEHVSNPTECLSNYVKFALPNSLFLIEIPIGPITPEHTISWDNMGQAIDWIMSAGLVVMNHHLTYVNPNVDLFAEPHKFDYAGFLALCRKV